MKFTALLQPQEIVNRQIGRKDSLLGRRKCMSPWDTDVHNTSGLPIAVCECDQQLVGGVMSGHLDTYPNIPWECTE